MKTSPKEAPKTSKNRGYFSVLIAVILFLGVISFFGDRGSLTTYLKMDSVAATSTALKSIPSLGAGTQAALFDVKVTVPDQSKVLAAGNELLLSVELTNIGSQKTDALITYIVTKEDGGEMVFIEHETKVVETQAQFLKSLALQSLPPGKYRIYVHLLYGQSTATSSDEFKVNLYK